MIYLDNAATGGFKISAVLNTSDTVNRYLCANPGRSGHRLSTTGAELVFKTRELFSRTFNCPTERVIFTKNCTEALNTAIFGVNLKKKEVLTTVFEHNSVLRPLYELERQKRIDLKILAPTLDKDIFTVIKENISTKTGMVITTMASNVTGEVLPVKKIGALLNDLGIIYVVDGAQAGGHVEVSINDGISALCLAGHKGLYGLMGTGVLLFSEDIEISPLIYGGTGSFSTLKTQPETYPEKLESGTINLSGVASLYEGLNYVNKNIKNFSEVLTSLTKKTIQGLSQIEGVKCYSLPNPVGIVSFLVKDLSSSEVSETLNSEFDIAVRGGLHCAPLMHTHLNTLETGLVRASFSAHNTSQEASSLVRAVKKIASRIKD